MNSKHTSALKSLSAAFAASALLAVPAAAQQAVGSVRPTQDSDVVIYRGGGITSIDGRFAFNFQEDGNLVLYQGSRALWSSKTWPRYRTVYPGGRDAPSVTFVTHGCMARFQSDGNLVVYGADGVVGTAMHPCNNPNITKDNAAVLWNSKTWGNPMATLKVQDDGNVVIYNSSNRAVWSTKTCCR